MLAWWICSISLKLHNSQLKVGDIGFPSLVTVGGIKVVLWVLRDTMTVMNSIEVLTEISV